MKRNKNNALEGLRGQSLVELALFLPIFLVIIAGLVEVSQLVITQNRITDAARAGTRFGANGGQDEGIITTMMTNITGTLNADPAVWDIWVIRGTLNPQGTDFVPETWQFSHAYGYSNTVRSADLNEGVIQANIIEELQRNHEGENPDQEGGIDIAGNLQIVGTYVIHDVESILGLDAVPALAGLNSVTELNVIRVASLSFQQTNGCSAFPIAVSSGIRSVTNEGDSNLYPSAGEFEYPPSPRVYESFLYHTNSTDLDNASEGTVFKVSRGFNYESGNFGWLKWNLGITSIGAATGDAAILSNSLTWPGDSNDYTDHGDSGTFAADGIFHVVRGYVKPGDATDQTLHKEDWVAASSAQLPQIATAVNNLIDSSTGLRVILFDTAEDAGTFGPNGRYFIKEFAIFRIIGYGNSGADNEWLLLELIRKDDSCGEAS